MPDHSNSEDKVLASKPPQISWIRLIVMVLSALTCCGCSMLAIIEYFSGAQTPILGLLLAGAAWGLALTLALVFRRLYSQELYESPRHFSQPPASVLSTGEATVPRRGFLALLGGAIVSLAAILVIPIRSLAPGFFYRRRVYWAKGERLYNEVGQPIQPKDIRQGEFVTALPKTERYNRLEAVTIVLKLAQGNFLAPTKLDWVVAGCVAYSKLCTHVGCPLGLYRAAAAQMLCPCHQSLFDVRRGAQPIGGPASEALPQLPLGLDTEGYLIALGDFPYHPGPVY